MEFSPSLDIGLGKTRQNYQQNSKSTVEEVAMLSEPAPQSLFTTITLVLPATGKNMPSREALAVGILPFIEMPEIVVWRNRAFVPLQQGGKVYENTKFAVADCTDADAVMVRLEVRNGGFVVNAMISNAETLPEVVRWGDRIFRLNEAAKAYREAFFAVAHNLETRQPEMFVD